MTTAEQLLGGLSNYFGIIDQFGSDFMDQPMFGMFGTGEGSFADEDSNHLGTSPLPYVPFPGANRSIHVSMQSDDGLSLATQVLDTVQSFVSSFFGGESEDAVAVTAVATSAAVAATAAPVNVPINNNVPPIVEFAAHVEETAEDNGEPKRKRRRLN